LARSPRPQFIIFDNDRRGEFKRELKKSVITIALMQNQLQVTTNISQENAIIERVQKLCIVNEIHRSFDLENNHENLETKDE
jgi:ABC-type Fe3+-citrate transport system substrate-binding protein